MIYVNSLSKRIIILAYAGNNLYLNQKNINITINADNPLKVRAIYIYFGKRYTYCLLLSRNYIYVNYQDC